MAKTIVTTTTDDLDGTANADTVTFAWDGNALEIDLNKRNRAAFEKAIAPYLAVARKISATRSGTTGPGRAKRSNLLDVSAIRAWAAQSGLAVSTRGRIPAAIVEAYKAAH